MRGRERSLLLFHTLAGAVWEAGVPAANRQQPRTCCNCAAPTTKTGQELLAHSGLPCCAVLCPSGPQALYDEMKFERPSKIQATTLPMILRKSEQGVYRDLIAQAHNGSGKTTCFVLAMLSRWVGLGVCCSGMGWERGR